MGLSRPKAILATIMTVAVAVGVMYLMTLLLGR